MIISLPIGVCVVNFFFSILGIMLTQLSKKICNYTNENFLHSPENVLRIAQDYWRTHLDFTSLFSISSLREQIILQTLSYWIIILFVSFLFPPWKFIILVQKNFSLNTSCLLIARLGSWKWRSWNIFVTIRYFSLFNANFAAFKTELMDYSCDKCE